MKNTFAFILASALSALCAMAQSIESKGFAPEAIRPGDTAQYTIVLKDMQGSIDASSIPLPDGLHVLGQSQSQSMSLGSGGVSSQLVLSYTVQADTEGLYTVPQWSVKARSGEAFSIAAATLKVDKNAPASAPRASSPISRMPGFGGMQQPRRQTHSSEINLKENIKMELRLPREKIYVGEAVNCEVVFTFDRKFVNEGYRLAQLAPSIQNADAFECTPLTSNMNVSTTGSDNLSITFHSVITPLKAGSYNLDVTAQGAFVREMSMDDMFDMFDMSAMMFGGGRSVPFEIKLPSKEIEVSELPVEGKPADFTGAIGKFSLEGVTVDPDSLTVGEPCIITAKLIGVGNFQRISAPTIQNGDDWKSYKPKSSFIDESEGNANIGVKTFEYTVVPNKPDLQFAPKLSFNYFDPENGKYVESASKEIPVSVAPSGRSKRAEEKALAESNPEPEFGHIVEGKPQSRESRLISSPLFWGAQILILAALIAFILMRRKALRLENDPAYAKKLRSRRECERRLKMAESAAAHGDCTAFFEHARSALQNALSADTEHESAALLLREAQNIMRQKGISEAEINDSAVFFEGADAMSFGGMKAEDLDLKKLDAALKKICKELK